MTVCRFSPETDLRNPLGADLHHHIAGLDEPLSGGLQIRIGGHGLVYKPVQKRVVIDLPPIRP
jgi:hypothetical protein